jgi:cytochrome c-type biogenesis protein CcmH/NrfG
MKRHPARKLQTAAIDPIAEAVARANRARRKGDRRGEANGLRQACLMDEYDAVLWARLGDAQFRLGRHDDALQSLRHALWLRERENDPKRASVLRRLIDCAAQRVPFSAAA